MTGDTLDGLISFFSSHYAMRASGVLRKCGIPAQLVPGPKELSPNCGVALQFSYNGRETVAALLTQHKIKVDQIHRYLPIDAGWPVTTSISPDI
ncbi:DUF3343 domain-containing protein [Kineobactrum salinum]|uniref:DUF3343 domain-containing protein n=1 Tax=Kineobactrum salinum TaxID=2708301 RepID=A0A6C0U075_9GAMM|nr:DUF3343 domain-containing protein [Kineobactrum salinum]QIB64989.1 DUF3343 domain-containing protein [Kineobactrum salinum]